MPNTPSLSLISTPSRVSQQPRRGTTTADIQDQLPSANEVRLGLRQGEFHAFLQPKFDLLTGHIYAVEVLARWLHPHRGLLGPAHFLPVMSREQWLDELLFNLLEQSLTCQLRLHAQGRLLGFAFNLSLGQLRGDIFVDRLAARVRKHPLPASTLTFEITEDGPASASAVEVNQLNALCRLGVRLSMDDFGTGYSTLWRLCQVPFSELKLAGEFTRSLDCPGHYQTVIRNAVTLAAQLGMQLVAEGIETRAHQARLAQMGVRCGQGYLCAKPMPVTVFEQWLETPRHTLVGG